MSEQMRAALSQAAEWFEDYERQHAAKGSIDGDAKARVNAERAAACRLAAGAEREAMADLLDGLRRRARECSRLSEGREDGSYGKASAIGKAKGYSHAADLLETLLKERHAN